MIFFFLCVFLYEITLLAIDIENIGYLEPFLPLKYHFEIRRFLGLKCKVDLILRLSQSQIIMQDGQLFNVYLL